MWFPVDTADSRARLVEKLVREGFLFDRYAREAMLRVPRELFVPREYKEHAYDDNPLPIGYGQTISAPHMVALMTSHLRVRPGHVVLEIGTGSGYQAAVLAEIVGDEGHVYTVERIRELAAFARRNLEAAGYIGRVTVLEGDGSKGYPEKAPYDRIIVTAAAPDIPRPLVNQLKPGGVMVIPVGDRFMQKLLVIRKKPDGGLMVDEDSYCAFVPLVGEYGWDL